MVRRVRSPNEALRNSVRDLYVGYLHPDALIHLPARPNHESFEDFYKSPGVRPDWFSETLLILDDYGEIGSTLQKGLQAFRFAY